MYCYLQDQLNLGRYHRSIAQGFSLGILIGILIGSNTLDQGLTSWPGIPKRLQSTSGRFLDWSQMDGVA